MELKRHADVYVFALLRHSLRRDTLDPLDLDHWEFYVLPKSRLNVVGSQGTIGLSGLSGLARLGALQCSFGELRRAVEEASR